ncbi:hypothetical protein [Virgibacillus sp. YIM 98842]|uniref:hypothetical protein n=1 Tax=Virgibacillus sp. YIM 98842 TaxID=2663533 RepID=UPI0013D9F4D6|nr:hypothetical protein [Virgibacillus sp. YIM 98842]
MQFNFTDEKNWAKKAYSGFGTALVGLILIVFQFYFQEAPIEGVIVFFSFIPLIIGLVQGVYYMSKHEQEYIYLEEDLLTIYHAPLLPRSTIYYDNIDYCIVVSNLLMFKLNNGREKQINTDYLSEKDFSLLREELKKRVKADLFRTSPHVHNRINVKNE